jgi:ABC-type multidrug transport system permease subunit
LTIFGGVWFSWFEAYKVFPVLGYMMLFNPVTYAMDGLKTAVFGQGNYLNFWLCVVVLSLFIVLFCMWNFYLLKRRLDYV